MLVGSMLYTATKPKAERLITGALKSFRGSCKSLCGTRYHNKVGQKRHTNNTGPQRETPNSYSRAAWGRLWEVSGRSLGAQVAIGGQEASRREKVAYLSAKMQKLHEFVDFPMCF